MEVTAVYIKVKSEGPQGQEVSSQTQESCWVREKRERLLFVPYEAEIMRSKHEGPKVTLYTRYKRLA